MIIFLGLEILSIATYVMAGFRRTDIRSNESRSKILHSRLVLVRVSALWHSPHLRCAPRRQRDCPAPPTSAEIACRLNDRSIPPLLFAGAAMMLVGFGFKIATAPFHVWTPDVYEGAPTAGYCIHGGWAKGRRLCFVPASVCVSDFPSSRGYRTITVSRLPTGLDLRSAACWRSSTMTVGNVVAIAQNNVKRMLAYSSIAHAGYALVGFIAAGAST